MKKTEEQLAELKAAYKAKKAAYHAAYRAANKEKIAARQAAWCAANKEKNDARKAAYCAVYRAANKEKIAARQAAWYAANKEKDAARKAAYYAANPEKRHECTVRYVRTVAGQTPAWSNRSAVLAIYREAKEFRAAGVPATVDHIVPLRGKLVSGLHNEFNLTLKLASWNFGKCNRFDPLTFDNNRPLEQTA